MSIMLVSLANVKAYLDIDSSVTNFDSLINILIQTVSDRIQTFLNRQLTKTQRTQYFDAGKSKYYLAAYPLDTSVTFTVVLDDETQTVNDDYYIWSDEGLVEFDDVTSYIEPKQIYITYTGGYTASETVVGGKTTYVLSVPDATEFACLLQVAYMFRRRADIGLAGVSMPDGSISKMVSGLLPEVKEILMMYRKFPMKE